MRTRRAVALVALVIVAATPVARAQVLPPVPPIPSAPEELQPLLELLAPIGGTVTEPGCAALGTVLGLGAVVVPGLPGTLESATGLSLATLPVALQPELLALVDTLLYVQGSGCGLLPLAAERTVCASDDDLAAAMQQVRSQLNLVSGLPVQVGDFVPVFAPTAGAVVDTFRVLGLLGVPGAAEVVAAFNDVGDCGLQTRFTNVEPPAGPKGPTPAPPPPAPPVPVEPEPLPPSTPDFGPPALPRTPVLETAPVVAAPPTAPATLPVSVPDALPGWLQWLAVVGLIAFLYRAVAPGPSS